MAMKLQFKASAAKWPGGGRYAVGKTYYLDRYEACLWIRRGVVDLATIEPADLTSAAEAENKRNLQPGSTALSLAEVVAALAAEPSATLR